MSAAPVLDLVHTLTLKEAIQNQYDSGLVDPHEIAREIITKLDEGWLATVLLEEAEEIIAEKARQYGGSWRRGQFTVIEGGQKRTDKYGKGFLASPVYVEGTGWKAHADLTAEDCEVVAGDYDRRAADIKAKGKQYRKLADLIRTQNVKTLGKAKGVEDVIA